MRLRQEGVALRQRLSETLPDEMRLMGVAVKGS
jgi:hypothetical protein